MSNAFVFVFELEQKSIFIKSNKNFNSIKNVEAFTFVEFSLITDRQTDRLWKESHTKQSHTFSYSLGISEAWNKSYTNDGNRVKK